MNQQQQPLPCPKCQGAMLTHTRQGVHIEQCGNCRGIFLDFGELEALTQLQAQWMQQQQMQQPGQMQQQMPPQQPAWGAQPYGHNQGYSHKRGFMRMLFSS